MSKIKTQKRAQRKRRIRNRKDRIKRRLRSLNWAPQRDPMFTATNIDYELSLRTRGIDCGGIGAVHLLARELGLVDAIDQRLHLLKVHLPYHESDHVLNIAYNVLCGGTCLEDLELRRNNEVYLDALGAKRIPDPTTAGDFCRRFAVADVETLMDVFNDIRLKVWLMQPPAFFEEAVIDVDGTIAPTNGNCKEGMDMAYNGVWGYAPLLVSLANTGEVLYLVNRSGNRPSHEGAAEYLDRAAELCEQAGFRSVLYRGDTDFSQTRYLDSWDAGGRRFLFGMDCMPNLAKLANELPEAAWEPLERPAKYEVQTSARGRREDVKERIVREREYTNIRLNSEQVAEFAYRPSACDKSYRMIVVRKNLTLEKGEERLFDEIRYLFYITNDREQSARELVFLANGRCNQENLIEQLKNGVRSMQMPVDNLVSNWAYMVMSSLAWSLKVWFALILPETGRWSAKHGEEKRKVLRMEFKTFVNAFMRVPCQIIRGGRRIVYRLLSWNPWQHVFLRVVNQLRGSLRC